MSEPTSTPHQVLIAHQRSADGGCSCESDGRDPSLLGRSHAEHQLDELRAAGYAIVRDYAPRVSYPAQPEHGGRGCPARHRFGDRWAACNRARTHPGVHTALLSGREVQWPPHGDVPEPQREAHPTFCPMHRGAYDCHRSKGHDGDHQDLLRGKAWDDAAESVRPL